MNKAKNVSEPYLYRPVLGIFLLDKEETLEFLPDCSRHDEQSFMRMSRELGLELDLSLYQ